MDDVARDGSPVAVYLALPSEPDVSRIRSLVRGRKTILDLGCGPGRIANPLAAEGHTVVAVDDSPAMLAHVVGAETMLRDVSALHLDRRFDVVLALSHLINGRDRWHRLELLRVCREHLEEDGIVVVQRYRPDWVPAASESAIHDITVRLHDVVHHDDGSFAAVVTYAIGPQSWSQSFEAAIVDDDELNSLALASDLAVRGTVDDDDGWVVLSAQDRG